MKRSLPVKTENNLSERIREAFLNVKESFPFKGYMECKLPKYMAISLLLFKEAPPESKILDIGCGPCDLTAILANLGYYLTGIDDLRNHWHLLGDNRGRIVNFAGKMGIKLIVEPAESAKVEDNHFDAVLLIDILEHSPNPRVLLNRAISALKPGGLLLVETPNAVALAKRILVAMGKSNYPNVNFAYFNVGKYRSHIREYTVHELKRILQVSGLTEIKAKLTNHAVYQLICETQGLKRLIVRLYYLISKLYPKFRSTILAYGRKPENWRPIRDLDAIKNLKNYYLHITRYNLDKEPDNILVEKLADK